MPEITVNVEPGVQIIGIRHVADGYVTVHPTSEPDTNTTPEPKDED